MTKLSIFYMMNFSSKPAHFTQLFTLLLVVFTDILSPFQFTLCTTNNTGILCHEAEMQALLSFKQTIGDPYNLLSSWNPQVDCCRWERLNCSKLSGHVLEVHLQNSMNPTNFHGTLNPSLVNLTQLRYLDLSVNSFEGKLPAFIGSFANLEHLNLSLAGFDANLPHNIGNLSNLRILSAQQNQSGDSTPVESLNWLSSLTHLEHLDMTYVNLSQVHNWLQVTNTLPSLLELIFRYCSLHSVPNLNLNHYSPSSNITKLRYIDLSGNSFNSSIPGWLYNCTSLEHMDLSGSFLQGLISEAIQKLTSLTFLDLSYNEFSDEIPSGNSTLCKLQYLDLATNKLHGDISNLFGNMSCFEDLEFVNLEVNMFSGNLNDQFGEFKSLRNFYVGNNSLSGPLPTTLGRSLSLESLDFAYNNFTGNLPMSFGRLSSLTTLYMEYNSLEGVVTESHFANLTNLEYFYASRNHLTLKVDSNWTPPLKLHTLRLGSWNLGSDGKIPTWLEKLKDLVTDLDLSNTGITGNVPSWFWNIPYLRLSHNRLYGNIADTITNNVTYLNSNQFNGSLPQLGSTVSEVDLSNNSFSGGISFFSCDTGNQNYNLKILNLGRNNLSGNIPDCWMRYPSLQFLNLGNNNLSGTIPKSIGLLNELQSLSLNNNNLSGKIPSSVKNCTRLVKLDLANNMFVGNLPSWIGTSLVNLRIFILHSNCFSGRIPSNICHLKFLQILDLSNNKIFGVIPSCVNNFTGMGTKRQLFLYMYGNGNQLFLPFWHQTYIYYVGNYIESASVTTKGYEYLYDNILSLVTNIDLSRNNLSGEIPKQLTRLVELGSLNLSNNHLTGSIPDGIGKMQRLESLDLSNNSLSGVIPNSLASISTLSHLNLSYNNLTGKIPQSTQLQGFNASSFIGNHLCGPPLPRTCSNNDGGTNVPDKNEKQGAGIMDVEWMYAFVYLGYTVGISVVLTTLILKKSWRHAYYSSMENLWDKFSLYCKRCCRK